MSIEDKILKLHAMTKDSATTDAEKDTAEKLMLKLIEQNRLDLQSILKKGENSDLVEMTVPWFMDNFAIEKGTHCIATIISKAFGCYTIGSPFTQKIIVLGTKSTTEQFEYFYTQISGDLQNRLFFIKSGKIAEQFASGFVGGLRNKVDELFQLNETGFALVLDQSAKMRTILDEKYHPTYSKDSLAHDKFNLGREAGYNSSFTKGVNTGFGGSKLLKG